MSLLKLALTRKKNTKTYTGRIYQLPPPQKINVKYLLVIAVPGENRSWAIKKYGLLAFFGVL